VNKEILARLGEPFPPESIGHKPTVWCKPCRERSCQQHQSRKCGACKQKLTTAHNHLDFVGHAFVRERFNQVDPDWNWEPMAYSPDGLPAFDSNGGLWIRLTIGGKTHPGYGDAPGKRGGDAIKEAIGDALRNAGQSFGVALEMWKGSARTDLIDDASDQKPAKPTQQKPADRKAELRAQIAAVGQGKRRSIEQIAGDFYEWSTGTQIGNASEKSLEEYLAHITGGGDTP
jgi:hypothetical protein